MILILLVIIHKHRTSHPLLHHNNNINNRTMEELDLQPTMARLTTTTSHRLHKGITMIIMGSPTSRLLPPRLSLERLMDGGGGNLIAATVIVRVMNIIPTGGHPILEGARKNREAAVRAAVSPSCSSSSTVGTSPSPLLSRITRAQTRIMLASTQRTSLWCLA